MYPESVYVLATDGVWDVMSDREVLCTADQAWLDNQVDENGVKACNEASVEIAQEAVTRGQ